MTDSSPRPGAETAIHSDALRLAPNSPDVLTTRGLVLFLSGKLPQALQHVQSALRLDPGHETAMQLRKRVKEVERLKEEGNKSFKSGDLSDAIEKYTAAIEVNHFHIEHETAVILTELIS
jgi:DnaJ family protein C protein 7